MRLHILTAVTRPQNLPRLAASIIEAGQVGADLIWHVSADDARVAVGGQAIKNSLIDHINEGWIAILDDDNLLHPGLVARLVTALADAPDAGLIVVGQSLPAGGYRPAWPGCLAVNRVDAAQIIIKRAALGDLRIPETYAGDGLLAEELAAVLPAESIVYLDEPLSYYNRLAWGDL